MCCLVAFLKKYKFIKCIRNQNYERRATSNRKPCEQNKRLIEKKKNRRTFRLLRYTFILYFQYNIDSTKIEERKKERKRKRNVKKPSLYLAIFKNNLFFIDLYWIFSYSFFLRFKLCVSHNSLFFVPKRVWRKYNKKTVRRIICQQMKWRQQLYKIIMLNKINCINYYFLYNKTLWSWC